MKQGGHHGQIFIADSSTDVQQETAFYDRRVLSGGGKLGRQLGQTVELSGHRGERRVCISSRGIWEALKFLREQHREGVFPEGEFGYEVWFGGHGVGFGSASNLLIIIIHERENLIYLSMNSFKFKLNTKE